MYIQTHTHARTHARTHAHTYMHTYVRPKRELKQVTIKHTQTDAHKGIANTRQKKHKRPTKEVPPRNGQLNILLEGLNRFHGAPTSLLIQMWIKTQRYLVCMKDP